MSELVALWLPIVVSTAALFVLSTLLWTALPLHSGDFKEVPEQDALMRELERQGMTRGQYLLPYSSTAEGRRSDEFKERYARGPQALLRVWPGPASMARNMSLTLAYFFVVSGVIAYAGAVALSPGTAGLDVFQLIATIGLLAFGAGGVLTGVWFAKPARVFLTDFVEALAYATTVGGVFAWLWPAADAARNVLEASALPV